MTETVLAGHYHVVRHLGGGGFGQTFLAKDSHLPGCPLCVVKQLQPRVNDAATLQTAKRLFDREAATLYHLGGHDQIPRLLAHFEENQEFYLVQDFIEGQTLDQELVPGQPISESAVIDLLHDILRVLAFVHQQHVIHRDIKPANLIRRHKDQKIVLIDFGAVKEVSTQAGNVHGQTSLTVAIGSPGYMPTEQQSFSPHFSSDIYAVGMVGIQALTGMSPKELPRDPRTGEFDCALFSDRISVSPELAAILDRMVRYDYRQRYENAVIALQALEELIAQRSETLVAILPEETPAPLESQPTAPILEPQSDLMTPSPVSSPSLSTLLERLPDELHQTLRELLANSIGPLATMLLNQTLRQAATEQELIDQLAAHLPEKERSQFHQRISHLLKHSDNLLNSPKQDQSVLSGASNAPASSMTSGTAPTENPNAVDPDFIKRCQQELTASIGPIASMIVQQTVTKNPQVSRQEFIEALAKHVPDVSKREVLRQALLALV